MFERSQSPHVRAQDGERFRGPQSHDEQFAQVGRAIGDRDIFVDDVSLQVESSPSGRHGSGVEAKDRLAGFDPEITGIRPSHW